jgi:hypothetical protein
LNTAIHDNEIMPYKEWRGASQELPSAAFGAETIWRGFDRRERTRRRRKGRFSVRAGRRFGQAAMLAWNRGKPACYGFLEHKSGEKTGMWSETLFLLPNVLPLWLHG